MPSNNPLNQKRTLADLEQAEEDAVYKSGKNEKKAEVGKKIY
jgi:hypothetical protein